MNSKQFVDRYDPLNQGYIKHKQNQYKHYYQEKLSLEPYTEELFWEKLVHLGWRKSITEPKIDEGLGTKPVECLVLVCPDCELAITKIILKNSPSLNSFLDVEQHITIHKRYCKATDKAE